MPVIVQLQRETHCEGHALMLFWMVISYYTIKRTSADDVERTLLS